MNSIFRAMQWVVRRLFNSKPSYDLLRRIYLRLLMWARRPHDPDFLAFKALAGDSPVFIDVGANAGQAAISISIVSPKARILSFEANKRLEPELRRIKRILGERFDYRMCALGPKNSKMKLVLPKIGDLPLETRGSLVREKFNSTDQDTEEMEVDVLRFDELGLKPDVIKIDVEGFEAEVLEGMKETVQRFHPVLLIEKSESYLRCKNILEELGYHLYIRSEKNGQFLEPEKNPAACNFFAIPPNHDLLSRIQIQGDALCGDQT